MWQTTAEGPFDGPGACEATVASPVSGVHNVTRPAPPAGQVPVAPTEPVTGLQVTEFEATLPLDIYGELFKQVR